jgi:hypothetical protein
MMTGLIASLGLALLVAASAPQTTRAPNPPYMQPPVGWTSLGPPPSSAPVDYGWVSPHFRDGSSHAGDSMEASVRPISPNSTLAEQVKELTTEETQDGRTVASSHSHATCNGTQPGWTIEFRLPLSPSVTISQVQHLAVFEGRVYLITFIHRADVPSRQGRSSINRLALPHKPRIAPPRRRARASRRSDVVAAGRSSHRGPLWRS